MCGAGLNHLGCFAPMATPRISAFSSQLIYCNLHRELANQEIDNHFARLICLASPEAILMTKVDDYRRSAADALRLAQNAKSSEDKRRLLAMAGAWLDLADRLCNRSREMPRSPEPGSI